MKKKFYITFLSAIICTMLCSCSSTRLPENVEGTEIFYYRFSMNEPKTIVEKDFWLSEEQQDEIYTQISKLKFSQTDHSLTHDTNGTSLDQVVVIFWDDGVGTEYYFYDGRVFYKNIHTQKKYAAEDNGKLVSTLRKWTAERFPELKEGE